MNKDKAKLCLLLKEKFKGRYFFQFKSFIQSDYPDLFYLFSDQNFSLKIKNYLFNYRVNNL